LSTSSSLRRRNSVVEGVFAAAPSASGQSAAITCWLSVPAAESHQQLEQVKRPLLRLSGEADRLAVANQLESANARHAAGTARRSCVGRRERIAPISVRTNPSRSRVFERELASRAARSGRLRMNTTCPRAR
jgi:hypothetical protein